MNHRPSGPGLRMTSGGRAGETVALRDGVRVGRDPDAEVRLEPVVDVHASSFHAVFRRQGRRWTVRDLGSSNGTWLNGARVQSETRIHDGDHLQFGLEGPEGVITWTEPSAGRGPALLGVGLLTIAVVVVSAFWVRDRDRWRRERDGLVAVLDSAVAATAQSMEVVERSASTSAVEASQLRSRLDSVTAALERQRRVATLDFAAIERANRPAVAMVYAETAEGEVNTGTAFSIDASGILVSNYHVVSNADGTMSRRLGVQFTGSDQVWPVRVVGSAPDSDLVLLQMEMLLGTVPTVRGLNAAGPTGDVVAMIGFPQGGGGAASENSSLPAPVLWAGILLEEADDGMEISGYGAPGSSGSPVFDARGEVVGIVYGGRPGGAPGSVFAVPARELETLLARLR